MTFGIIDLIILGVVIVSVLFALYRGLVRELLGISSWLLAGFVALYSYNPLLKASEGTFENVKLAAIVGSVLLANKASQHLNLLIIFKPLIEKFNL